MCLYATEPERLNMDERQGVGVGKITKLLLCGYHRWRNRKWGGGGGGIVVFT